MRCICMMACDAESMWAHDSSGRIIPFNKYDNTTPTLTFHVVQMAGSRALWVAVLVVTASAAKEEAVELTTSLADSLDTPVPSCKAAYHMGAILDVSEKACEAIKEVSHCAHRNQCNSGWSELNGFVSAFLSTNSESAW